MTPTQNMNARVLDLPNCARPVLFQNDDQAWPFSNGGTAFVVLFRGLHFIVTAKHVLNIRNFELSQFRVQYRPDLNRFLPLSGVLFDDPVNGELDTDKFDVAAFSVAEDQLDRNLFGDYQPYTLQAIDRLTVFNAGAVYMFKGYPIGQRELNFEDERDRRALTTGVVTRGTYVGAAAAAGVRELALLDMGMVEDIDGMSGSPVFQVIAGDDGIYSYEAFAGMLIRGYLPARRAYFLEHQRIIGLLERFAGRIMAG